MAQQQAAATHCCRRSPEVEVDYVYFSCTRRCTQPNNRNATPCRCIFTLRILRGSFTWHFHIARPWRCIHREGDAFIYPVYSASVLVLYAVLCASALEQREHSFPVFPVAADGTKFLCTGIKARTVVQRLAERFFQLPPVLPCDPNLPSPLCGLFFFRSSGNKAHYETERQQLKRSHIWRMWCVSGFHRLLHTNGLFRTAFGALFCNECMDLLHMRCLLLYIVLCIDVVRSVCVYFGEAGRTEHPPLTNSGQVCCWDNWTFWLELFLKPFDMGRQRLDD